VAAVKRRAVLPPTYLFAAIVLMALFHFALPGAKVITFPCGIVGALPFALGIALNLTADRQLKRHGTTVKPFEESSALITDGVFRLTRHPMYLGFALILLGLAVFAGTATPFAVVVLFPLVMELAFVRTEERMLKEKFGDEWRRYRVRVRRWL